MPAVFVAMRAMEQQVLNGDNLKPFQLGRALRSNARQFPD